LSTKGFLMPSGEQSPTDTLILFSRYTRPGHTKTRLIPLLGEKGAALLQKNMTEKNILELHALSPNIVKEIWFTGGNEDEMRQWLGNSFRYHLQPDGDLGHRMQAASNHAFMTNCRKLVLIGSDCPLLTTDDIITAFARLELNDLVIGPAGDGGYYLIGMTHLVADLFSDIPWGSDQVLDRTLAKIGNMSLSCSLLPTLADVDRPEDLVHLPASLLP